MCRLFLATGTYLLRLAAPRIWSQTPTAPDRRRDDDGDSASGWGARAAAGEVMIICSATLSNITGHLDDIPAHFHIGEIHIYAQLANQNNNCCS